MPACRKHSERTDGRVAMRDIAEEWLKDPEFRAEYEALEPEFALASASGSCLSRRPYRSGLPALLE